MWFAWTVVLSWLMTSCGVLLSVILQNTGVPLAYGRHGGDTSSYFSFSSRDAWTLFSFPSLLVPAVVLALTSDDFSSEFGRLLTSLLLFNSVHRTVVYPLLFRRSSSQRRIDGRIVFSATVFSAINAFCQSVWNWKFQPEYTNFRPQFLIYFGVFLYFAGFVIHVASDAHLTYLGYRKPDGYSIPRGGVFEWISCPNYFGECLQWIGYATAARNFPAIAYAFFTVCHLAPRARAHHEWYLKTFGDWYPVGRRALVPFFW